MKTYNFETLKEAVVNPDIRVKGWSDFNKVQTETAAKKLMFANKKYGKQYDGKVSFITSDEVLHMMFGKNIPKSAAQKLEAIRKWILSEGGFFYYGNNKRDAFRLAERYHKSWVITETPIL
jgi:hypothetical protein